MTECFREKILAKTKTVVTNRIPINERKFTLIEVLMECDSDKNRSRYFRKDDSMDYVVSSKEYTSSIGYAPFHITINVEETDFLDYVWYEVSSLYV